MTDERPCCAARQAAPVRAEVSMLNMEALKAQIAQLRVQLAACLLAAEGGAEADADVARAGAQSPAFDAVRRLRARAEQAERERDDVKGVWQPTYLRDAPHDAPADCPTYYDGCNCTSRTLGHNIERAEKAEAAIAAESARVERLHAEIEKVAAVLLGPEYRGRRRGESPAGMAVRVLREDHATIGRLRDALAGCVEWEAEHRSYLSSVAQRFPVSQEESERGGRVWDKARAELTAQKAAEVKE
jgi:hypothetical protein